MNEPTTKPTGPAPEPPTGNLTEVQETLLNAAHRLEGLAGRLQRNRDFLSEWTVRSVAWELISFANSAAARKGGENEQPPSAKGDDDNITRLAV